MPKQYSPRRFLRQVSNHFLKIYFSRKQLLSQINFEKLSETDIEPIYSACLQLPEPTRNKIEQDFQQMDEMATEAGCKAILDEAQWHGENLAEQFSALKGFHERAFWTFLERSQYWMGATAFNHADSIPSSYWRKRKNLPPTPAQVDDLHYVCWKRSSATIFISVKAVEKIVRSRFISAKT